MEYPIVNKFYLPINSNSILTASSGSLATGIDGSIAQTYHNPAIYPGKSDFGQCPVASVYCDDTVTRMNDNSIPGHSHAGRNDNVHIGIGVFSGRNRKDTHSGAAGRFCSSAGRFHHAPQSAADQNGISFCDQPSHTLCGFDHLR